MARALTDDRFRDRNQIDKTFADRHGYSLLTKASSTGRADPAGTDPDVRLDE